MVEVAGYTELEVVGHGAAAVVYRARQEAVNRIVALKVLQATLDDDGRRRFSRECEAVGMLGWHPRVVAVFDAGTTDTGHPYLALEYLPAGSLADRLKTSGPLSSQEVVDVGIQIADALAAAHAQGLVHRDVKPGNLLISAVGDYKLADFGIVAVDGANTSATGSLSGTIAFMAPELFGGARADASTDLYALGASLFTLAAGRVPFEAETPLAVLGQISRDPIPDLRAEGIGDDLATVIERCTAKDASDRPATASVLIRELQTINSAHKWPTQPTYTDRHQPDGPLRRERDVNAPTRAPWHDLDEPTRTAAPPPPAQESDETLARVGRIETSLPPNTGGSEESDAAADTAGSAPDPDGERDLDPDLEPEATGGTTAGTGVSHKGRGRAPLGALVVVLAVLAVLAGGAVWWSTRDGRSEPSKNQGTNGCIGYTEGQKGAVWTRCDGPATVNMTIDGKPYKVSGGTCTQGSRFVDLKSGVWGEFAPFPGPDFTWLIIDKRRSTDSSPSIELTVDGRSLDSDQIAASYNSERKTASFGGTFYDTTRSADLVKVTGTVTC